MWAVNIWVIGASRKILCIVCIAAVATAAVAVALASSAPADARAVRPEL